MKQVIEHSNDMHYLAVTLLAALAVSLVANFMFFVRESEMRSVVTCASFSSYAEMMRVFSMHPELDRNKDGRPCQDTNYKNKTTVW